MRRAERRPGAPAHNRYTLAVAVLALTASTGALAQACRAVSPPYTVALVELYTSQGCSSCPPADKWLSKLQTESPLRAIPLALHVGYWDYIGWKDPFARHEFNDRQRLLVGRHETAYTPEVFVGGTELEGWGQRDSFGAAVDTINARTPRAHIDLQAHWLPPAPGDTRLRRLAVHANWASESGSADPQLLLAVKRSGYVTDVRSGENGGSQLRNDHVVRAWEGPFSARGQPLQVEIAVPADPGDATLVAIAQDAGTGAVLQAVELGLASCDAAAEHPTQPAAPPK